MKNLTCTHPRRMVNLMKKFVNQACDLTVTCEYRQILNPEDHIQDWIFGDYYSETFKRNLLIHKGENFCVMTPDCDLDDDFDEDLVIHYNTSELNSEGAKFFRAYWTQIFPMFKGFSDITITLLHELGHLETHNQIRQTYTIKDRIENLIKINMESETYEECNKKYFGLPDEKMATEWAAQWLSNPENRKIAKHFEKEFFACFQ